MDVRIEHCAVCWGYRERALGLAQALRERFGATVEVAEGTLGQFDVVVDGCLLWSRGESLLARMKPPRLPEASRVIETIEQGLPSGEKSCDGARIELPTHAFGPEDAKHFYDRSGAKQDLQFYERTALDDLAAHAGFEHASAVFEWGCGTGRFAERLLQNQLTGDARYLGIDISDTMIALAKRRLARWRGRAEVLQADGTKRLPCTDASFDRFVATYVLDLLPEAAICDVLCEARRLLTGEGKLCVVSSTEGVDALSRLLCSAWKRIYAINPRFVGGCRPLRVCSLLDECGWRIEHKRVVSSWGICSEIVIAVRV